MKIDRFLQLFIVKEKKFYPMFISQMDIINQATKELKFLFLESNYDAQKELYKKINSLEVEGDHITGRIYQELEKTFVTPFDREDIHMLAYRIDTYLDFIHDSARKQVMYKPKNTYKDMITIIDYLIELSEILKEMVGKLEFIMKKHEEIVSRTLRIIEIERHVDQLYEDFNCFLFENEKDAIELVKHKNIVQSLEDATDRAKDISDCIRSIIVKQV
jgi:predicted phosphate transport protein (TIGR00153 family)